MTRSDTAETPRRGSEGFTLIEVVVTALIMTTVLGALLGVLESSTKVERRTQALISSQEDVRFALAEVLRDVRAADPLLPLTSVTAYANSLELRHGEASTPVYLRWTFDATTTTLTRNVLAAAGGSPTGDTYRLLRVRNSSATPVFRYYNSEGTELSAANATSADFANCAIRVKVTISADTNPDPGMQAFTLTSDAELRNRLPGGVGC